MKLDFTNNKNLRNLYHIYTDGSSRGNPGPGGYACVILNEKEDTIHKIIAEDKYRNGEPTTNNRMELLALLRTFQWIDLHRMDVPKDLVDQYIIYSDSAYAITALTEWCKNWETNGWKTSKGKPVENSDLIFPLYKYYTKLFYECQLEKIQGHADVMGNELADACATGNSKKFMAICDKYALNCDTI